MVPRNKNLYYILRLSPKLVISMANFHGVFLTEKDTAGRRHWGLAESALSLRLLGKLKWRQGENVSS